MATPYTNSPHIADLGAELEAIVAAADAAAIPFADTHPKDRAKALVAVADALEAASEKLVAIAIEETGLSEGRLSGEVKRTAVQLRMFADVVVRGAYLDARIDEADPNFALGVRPDLRRVLKPVGPIINFAASNFPFAFSVAGGDTAAALAAGCPVILKAHSGHPKLSDATAEVVTAALREAGMPDGVFAIIHGQEAGTSVLKDPRIQAGSFTGSVYVGRLLADIAAARPQPIPFFGELGSVNPLFVTAAAVDTRGKDVAEGLITAVAGSAGQLCTKPGFVFLPENAGLEEHIVAAVSATNADLGEQRLLNPGIARGYNARRDELFAAHGVTAVVEGASKLDADGQAFTTPTVLKVGLADFRAGREQILEEAFGPLTVLVEVPEGTNYADLVYEFFEGSLTMTLQTADGEVSDDLKALVRAGSEIAGRIIYNGWPTGVAVSYAQQHGGPWPATTNDSSTSVGAAAITRFMRPVAYQSVPDALLPEAVRDANPWNVPQSLNPAGSSLSWGEF